MEELLESVDINSAQQFKVNNSWEFGYAKEIYDKQNQEKIGTQATGNRQYANYDTMSRKESRTTAINSLYDNISAEMTAMLSRDEVGLYKKGAMDEDMYEGEKKDKLRIENYSQDGILQSVNELTYESTMATKCEQRNSTKSSRKRKEKREKALQKHKEAVMAVSSLAFERFRMLGGIGGISGDTSIIRESEKAIIYEDFKASQTAKMKMIEAIRDADKYDYENNIKMRRIDNKRVIDMGKGTSDFFVSLARLRTRIKCEELRVVASKDYDRLSELLPQEQRRRYDAKEAKFQAAHKNERKGMEEDLGVAIMRVPDLICALNPGEDKASLLELAKKVIANPDGFHLKAAIVNKIMTNPGIASCIRKDMSGTQVPSSEDFVSLANELKQKLETAANSKSEGEEVNHG